ncbi:hypothetical protein Csp2054_09005 [Curtobacterium sp. 'Ferrero']|uniref:hypothetical protein n=1 Tax=Curtobacterium sp. 'Ferrero' TaxID=2033654 RepID=UPI000BD663BB|nr:hypothetical protein [Curtobacterium sp. 'Ferrero']PCN48001.1 hypothetical protein Csp2054_09005 [Curtobacterium sp. 'Ferrero']
MSAWEPTPAERRKYAGYEVEFREARAHAVRITEVDGQVGRAVTLYYRIPSLRKFVVYYYADTSARERRLITSWGRALPSGGWARHADRWRRRRIAGRSVHVQEIAVLAEDPFAQLELELMIDADSEVTA